MQAVPASAVKEMQPQILRSAQDDKSRFSSVCGNGCFSLPSPLVTWRRKRPGSLPGFFAFIAIEDPSYRNPSCESGGLKLPEVTLLMAHVILDQETQRYRRIVVNPATRIKPL